MKIVIPILGFAKEGGYRVLSRLADAWLDEGHEVTFLVPETSRQPYFPTRANIIKANRKGIVAPADVRARKVSGWDNVRSIYSGLRRIGRNYDVVLANHCLTAWPVKLAHCGLARKAYYIQAYEPEYYPFRSDPIKHMLARASYHLGLIHISNSRAYPFGTAAHNCEFLPPGIDLQTFYSRTDRHDFADQSTITLGTIGRTEPYKGTQLVLDAFTNLHQTDSRFRLRVAFGNLPAGWSHPAAEVIEVHGDAELAQFYRDLDILLVACKGQIGAPHYPVIEALACGTPVVHTGYFPGDNQNSWPVEQNNPAALVAGVHEVMASTDVHGKTANGLEFVRKNLGWPSIAAAMLQYFR